MLSGLVIIGFAVFFTFYFLKLKRQLSNVQSKEEEWAAREEQLSNELAEYKNKLIQEVANDALTGLPSLSVFKEKVQSLLNHSRQDESFGIVFLDLRNFHVINNSLGYGTGDFLLKEVARRLRDSVGHIDAVCRLSGDIFVILLAQRSHPEYTTLTVQRLLNKLTEFFYVDNHALCILASIGIAMYPQHGEDVDALFKNAAQALSQAKQMGAQQIVFYHAGLEDLSQREFLLNASLLQEQLFDELLIEYQPQIDIRDNSVFSWEALLRWQHPELGFVPAGEFIQLAENSGRIEAIGDWVLQKVCHQLRFWRSRGYLFPAIYINISLRQLQSPHFVSAVLRTLKDTQVDPKQLIFEISESVFLKAVELIEKHISFLSQMGIRICVDHFGMGDALLQQIKHIPIYGFKLSSQLICNITTSKECETMVAMMINLANSMDKHIIALGVETEAQKQLLQKLGCLIMQGHFFSVPLRAFDVTKKFPLQKIKAVQQEDLTVS